MVRRHGWELPAHTFQVVAITVFFLLAVAFYIFLAPFFWVHVLEFIAVALYSPLAVAVFFLYIRSSAIDPADPGVFAHQSQLKNTVKPILAEASVDMTSTDALQRSPCQSTISVTSSFLASESKLHLKAPYLERSRTGWMKTKGRVSFSAFFGVLFWWLIKDDSCRRDITLQKPLAEEDVLFCTLCNAEVRKFSKHCRSCDKCVDGFDHHCRWLNNCVGTKNYNTFVSLMASSLALLVLEWGIGMAVLVRCFVDKEGLERQIVDKLGNSFSRAPFAVVVAICTLVSLLASIPLGELFFFHLILIRKGITTYEYVVAMRAQNEPQGFSVEGDTQSVPTSPSSSTATGMSGSSSLGLQYSRGAWCTPPRVFDEHEDEIMPQLEPGTLPSTTDPDLKVATSRQDNYRKRASVRISAWKLSRLKADDATRAAMKAREKSSTLRHLAPRSTIFAETENTSSGNMSSQDSVSIDELIKASRTKDAMAVGSLGRRDGSVYSNKDNLDIHYQSMSSQVQSRRNSLSHSFKAFTHLTPLPAERRYGLNFQIAGFHLPNSLEQSSMSNMTSKDEGSHRGNSGGTDYVCHLSHSSVEFPQAWTVSSPPAPCSDGYEASSGESADGDCPVIYMHPHACNSRDHVHMSVKEGEMARAFGDQHREGSGSVCQGNGFEESNLSWRFSANSRCALSTSPPQRSQDPTLSPSQVRLSRHSASRIEPSTSLMLDNLIYSGTSIFYSDPIEELPVRISRSEEDLPMQHSTEISRSEEDLPMQHSTEISGLFVKSAATVALRPPIPRPSIRSQSPVFTPKTMLPLPAVNR